ncbi:MAG: helix-turn-helix transcriptional regulator [Campylobacterota bacterium]|nr:helix-turn-helix transcriptional regulator [Campylobacterota bacterium]
MEFVEFGKAISTLRKQQKISQSQLSSDLGISRATISSFENGKGVDIGLRKVLQIVEYLGYDIELKESSIFPTFEELRDGK